MSINIASVFGGDAFPLERIPVKRRNTQFVRGGTQTITSNLTIPAYASLANGEDLKQLPEGDRVEGAVTFYCLAAVYASRAGASTNDAGISDVLTYNGLDYRIAAVKARPANGTWKAIGVRVRGA